MTRNVTSTCSALTTCSHLSWLSRASTAETQTAQAKCSDGIAASWLAWSPIGEPQEPQVWPCMPVSTKPCPASRGGAVGHSAKQAMATTLSRTNDVRAERYSSGRLASSQNSRTNADSTYVVAYS